MASSWERLQSQASRDETLAQFLHKIKSKARELERVPPVEYEKEGYRLLTVSRRALRRIVLLSFSFRLSGDVKLARRAAQEMLAVAAFADWNPSHFLDTAEMTAALALGYDWLFDQLEPSARKTIREAIVQKGLRPGLDPQNVFHHIENNWNQVCYGGLALGALAVAEDEPELAAQILQLVNDNNQFGLRPYQPEGVYPEGPMYWGYGTTYQVILLAALESALGTDWGLSQSPGFLASAEAHLQMIAPSRRFFNFFDCVEGTDLQPSLFWFARKLQKNSLLHFEYSHLEHFLAQGTRTSPLTEKAEDEGDRFLPLVALWWTPKSTESETDLPLYWQGRGSNPLAVFRSSWSDPQAMYLALKGGKAVLNHGHMDAGSFVFEAGGVRWAKDLGMQDYHSLESRGINMWNSDQEGERWKVFRFGPFSHNTLTINGQLHRCHGQGTITHFSADKSSPMAVVDLSPVFKGQADKARRGFVFRSGSHVLIRDEIEGLRAGDTVRWAMLTKAEISLSDTNGGEAVLSEDGQKLRVALLSSVAARFEVVTTQPSESSYDAPNPGARLLIVNLTAPASGQLYLSVILQPSAPLQPVKAIGEQLAQTQLRHWPQAP
jgi:hypothetical protein